MIQQEIVKLTSSGPISESLDKLVQHASDQFLRQQEEATGMVLRQPSANLAHAYEGGQAYMGVQQPPDS